MHMNFTSSPSWNKALLLFLMACATFLFSTFANAHGVDETTKQFISVNQGVAFIPFIYIGAKHMITGYDHLLFLLGVIFFLYRNKDVLIYVSLFAAGHSITLLTGVLADINVNAYIVDAIIGFSIVYKGFDNLGGWKKLLSWQPSTKGAVAIFGLIHGFGLATKLQELQLPSDGLIANLIAFNIGVELGQLLALGIILIIINIWRRSATYLQFATVSNTLIMASGFMFIGYQVTGYLQS